MEAVIRFLKNWTLPVAMGVGAIGYFLFANLPFMAPLKPMTNALVAILTPLLIFAQLLLTFCKVSPQELVLSAWHGWLLLIQLFSCMVLAALLLWVPMNVEYKEVFEGAMVCFICPTATAAAVITGKLGGSASSLTTYTLLSNLLAAVVVPLVFPLVEPHADISFFAAFLKILSKVFPLLLCPFILACFFRRYMPASLVVSDSSAWVELWIAMGGLVACVIQFYLGKRIGSRYNDRISAGQALGQKNTVLAIWMAYTYLNPVSSVGPGSYVLWQNMFNSWQLWKKQKNESK